MRARRDVGDQRALHIHWRDQRNVGQMGPGDERIVDDDDIARVQRTRRRDGRPDR